MDAVVVLASEKPVLPNSSKTGESQSARPVGSGGGGWRASGPPNNLLKFANFVSEKGCKSKGRKNEDSNLYMFKEATRIYQKMQYLLMSYKSKNSKFSWKDSH